MPIQNGQITKKKKKKKGPPFVNGKLTVTAILCPSNFNDDFILSKPPPPPGEGGEGFSRWKLLHTFNFEKSKTRNLLLPYYLWEEREREKVIGLKEKKKRK